MLTIICPIYNEEKYIARCIESIMAQDYPKDDLEVLFVDGMSTDRTREIIASYLPQCSYLRVLDNPHKIVPYAMNKGISEAKGDIIMRIDAHTFYEPNYCSAIVKRLKELDAENVGCVCKTDVLNKTPKTLAIREVLSNKFGVGNSAFRTGIDGVKEVDTVPFGCWPKRVFEKYGQYDVRLVRNQDIELSKRIINGGGKIYIIPDTFCTYLARETFSGLAKNNFGNGKWNILTVYYTRQMKSLSLRHFIPLLFVLSEQYKSESVSVSRKETKQELTPEISSVVLTVTVICPGAVMLAGLSEMSVTVGGVVSTGFWFTTAKEREARLSGSLDVLELA